MTPMVGKESVEGPKEEDQGQRHALPDFAFIIAPADV